MKEKGKVIFDKRVYQVGTGSLGITLPPQILKAINARKGTDLKLMVDTGKHGTFLALWNPKQQKKEQEE